MPGGDRTGPVGAGPRTGRAAGFCTGNRMPGYANPVGRGFGGGGFGRGWCNRFFATGMPGRGRGRGSRFGGRYGYPAQYAPGFYNEDETVALKEEAEYLRSALDNINRRLDELQTSKKEE
jgi:hypothetical protein